MMEKMVTTDCKIKDSSVKNKLQSFQADGLQANLEKKRRTVGLTADTSYEQGAKKE